MLAKLNTFALQGIDALPVEVEVDASPGLNKIILVGLPEMAVKLPHTKWPKLVASWHELEQLDSPMKRNELTRRIQAVEGVE